MDKERFFYFIGALIYSFFPFLFFCAVISLVASFFLGSNVSVFTVMKIIFGTYIFLFICILIIALLGIGYNFFTRKSKLRKK